MYTRRVATSTSGYGSPLGRLLDAPAAGFEIPYELRHLKEREIHVHLVPPPLIQVTDLLADVRGQQSQPLGLMARRHSSRVGVTARRSRCRIE
jgi:hypothetical protein